jgi:GNAT superfamily N-acetyltransferase
VRVIEVPLDDPRAVALRAELDADMDERYAGFHPADTPELAAERERVLAVHPDDVVAVYLALDGDDPLGHVILRRLGTEWEIKRLVVSARARRRGVGRAILQTAVERARAGGASRVILQTGLPQPESRALYAAEGFTPIDVYEPYRESMPRSLCFERVL